MGGARHPLNDAPRQARRRDRRAGAMGSDTMQLRTLGRSGVLAAAALLAFAGVTSADSVRADGDLVSAGVQRVVYLGEVAPSAEIVVHVGFVLTCADLSHADTGQTIALDFESSSHYGDGDILSVSSASLGPVPSYWTADDEGCPFPAPTFTTSATSDVRLRAPSAVGTGFTYTIFYSRTLSPLGNADDAAWGRSSTAVSFQLDVVDNTPPILHLPTDMTVEGDTTGGWTAAFTATADDAEDAPDPTPSCQPAAGDLLSLGVTTVTCSVADSGGLKDSGSFDVTVVDTTAPKLTGMPADRAVTTHDPSGTTLTYAAPDASDIVDASPAVSCSPASGSHVGLGTTTVTCTATDASGNHRSASFDVVVSYVPLHTATATWGEPVAGSDGTFSANHSRTIPVKVRLFVDGTERTDGTADLRVVPCGGSSAVVTLPMTYGGGRWNAPLDTSLLAGSCYTIRASVDGLSAGTFRLELTGLDALKVSKR
jgi:hypothetical protein